MRALFGILVLAFLAFSCSSGGGGGGGFTPTGRIVAVAEKGDSTTVVVGGPGGAVTPGSAVLITNLGTGETVERTAGGDGGFQAVFTASTNAVFRVVAEADGVDITIGVTLLSDAVSLGLATLGSVPADIEILGTRAYVVNGFSDNIQVFDITQNPPVEVGTIVLPLGQNPGLITFIGDNRAVLPNSIGQSVAVVNIQSFTCELIIANEPADFTPCEESVIIPGAFEEPSGVTLVDGKLFVTNNNLDPMFSPMGPGFITIIDFSTLELVDFVEASGAHSASPALIGGLLWVLNSGNTLFDLDTFLFSCDTDFPPSIDIIDPETGSIIGSIPIPLSPLNPDVCFPFTLAPTPDGRFAYMGLGIVGALLKVDLLNRILVRGTDDPIFITDLDIENQIEDIKFTPDGLGFMALFNTDQIAVLDSNTDTVNPFPFITPFPAGLKAFEPGIDFVEGVQFLALAPQGMFPDIYYITAISSQLNSIDTSMVIAP